MKPEEQRIAIAEACGWKWYRRPASGPWAAKPMRSLYHPQLLKEDLQAANMAERQCNPIFIWREGMIPDYLNDLNACHEMEKVLTPEQEMDYVYHLSARLINDPRWDASLLSSSDATYKATAPQRCKAFLLTIKKWKY